MDTSTPTLAYLAGTGHSGSTLFSFVLNTNSRIFAIGEMHAPYFPREDPARRMCSCGAPMKDCAFFRTLASRLEPEGFPLDPTGWDLQYRMSNHALVNRLMAGSLRNTTLENLRDRLWRSYPSYRRKRAALDTQNRLFVNAALAASGKNVFLDATKDPIRIRYLAGLDGIRLKVIHLVRDPRAYAYSRIRDTGMSADRAAGDWLRTNTNVDRLLRHFPNLPSLRVSYEKFCTDSEASLTRIGEFLGTGPIASPENFRDTEHHIMGNKMRLPQFALSTIKLDEQWREHLIGEDLARVVALTRPLARAYGYEF